LEYEELTELDAYDDETEAGGTKLIEYAFPAFWAYEAVIELEAHDELATEEGKGG
jgi:hypothetical protein